MLVMFATSSVLKGHTYMLAYNAFAVEPGVCLSHAAQPMLHNMHLGVTVWTRATPPIFSPGGTPLNLHGHAPAHASRSASPHA